MSELRKATFSMRPNQRLNQGPDRLHTAPVKQFYVESVLGVSVAPRESFKELKQRLTVFVERDLQADERDLIQKMLAAISEPDYLLQISTLDEAQLAKHGINFAITFASPAPSTMPLKWVELPSLDNLLGRNSTKEQMTAAKKTAWAQLQSLKQEMDAWGV